MKKCSKCKKSPPRKGQRYCASCHAEYMKEWHRTHKAVSYEILAALCDDCKMKIL